MRTRARHEDDDEPYDDDVNGADAELDVDDPDAPLAADVDGGDEPGFIACPNCRKMILEDSERCPRCGEYVEEAALARRPLWQTGVLVLLLFTMVGGAVIWVLSLLF